MIRNETFVDGICVRAEIIDPDAMTVTFEEAGVVVGSRPAFDADLGPYLQVKQDRDAAAARAAVLAKFAAFGITEDEAVLAGLIPAAP